jgi:23S rRNA (cytidine1920-2'-O)/16S rRNA (cytidine1409-2'-O)-methyltransferase
LTDVPSLGVVDTSFISLKKVLPPLSALLTPDSEILALLKPQFEYRDYIGAPGFKGVVRQSSDHQRIVEGVTDDLAALLPDWRWVGLDFSPITGPKGNIEFLLHLVRGHIPGALAFGVVQQARIAEIITKSYEFHAAK